MTEQQQSEQSDILSDAECDRMIRQLADARGDDGISQEELEKAADELRDLKLDGTLWAMWCSGRIRLSGLDDQGELLWSNDGCMSQALVSQSYCRLAYADPPYPGQAKRLYGPHPDYAGEVDHAALIGRLNEFDGWALSTSNRSLADMLALTGPQRVLAWC